MARKRKISQKREINQLSISDFILLAIFLANNSKKEANFENLLQQCFELSPEVFCLSKKLDWPDARKIDKPIRTLRKKGLLKGLPGSCFSLTAKGKKLAETLFRVLSQKKLFKD